MESNNTANRFNYDLTTGDVRKQLVRFSLPFLGAMLLQAFYNVADTVIVGIFNGDAGISAVGTGGQITILLTNLVIGLATGGTILIAQYVGAKRYDEQKRTISTLFTLYGIIAVVLTAVLLPLVPAMIKAMATPAEAVRMAEDYLYICIGGLIFIFGYNAVSAVLRGMGNSKTPLLFVAISASTNVVLDLLLVGPWLGLNMGAAGAAWATIAAQALSFVMSVIYLKRRDFVFDFKLKSFRFDKAKAALLMKVGTPTSLQNLFVSLSFLILVTLANGFGLNQSSAYIVGMKVNSFAILPAIAMSQSISSMCGQAIGAGDPDRAFKTMKTGLVMTVGMTLVVGAVLALFPEVIMSAFGADVGAQTIGANFIRMIALDALFSSVIFSLNGLFLGGGHTIVTMVGSALSSIIFRAPLAYLFAVGLGMELTGIGLGVVLAPIGGGIFTVGYLLTGRWRHAATSKHIYQ